MEVFIIGILLLFGIWVIAFGYALDYIDRMINEVPEAKDDYKPEDFEPPFELPPPDNYSPMTSWPNYKPGKTNGK